MLSPLNGTAAHHLFCHAALQDCEGYRGTHYYDLVHLHQEEEKVRPLPWLSKLHLWMGLKGKASVCRHVFPPKWGRCWLG